MARARKPKAAIEPPIGIPQPPAPGPAGPGKGETTGRFVVIFKDDVSAAKVKATLNDVAGIKSLASSADYLEGAFSAKELADDDPSYFPKLGLVIVNADSELVQSLATSTAEASSPILAIEPEYMAYTAGGTPLDYLRGYRDAVNHLYDELTGRGTGQLGEAEAAAAYEDNDQFTWGLQATRANTSRYSGQAIKVAVLDTGFDLQHPDFQGRPIKGESFIQGQTVQDGNGHGTHCVGTACGPQRPAGTRRYGVAYGSQIYAGKVLSNQGSGSTAGIVAGIEWAMTNGCRIISMSLSANVNQQLQQYEVPIRRALEAGTLVVAAAGNNADRAAGDFGFVCPPANADAAMAVGALDSRLRVANFSARSSTVVGDGGKVNIAAPGVDVFSSWPMPTRYRSINGTSMATPHVAGIAALWCHATGATGAALWAKVAQNARPLSASAADVGTGLAQAPQ